MRSLQEAYERGEKKDSIRHKLQEVIFGADTKSGKAFDVALFIAIVLFMVIMMLESVHEIQVAWGRELKILDWSLTILFTTEYVLRIWTTGKPLRYILSFYGIVDLLSILPAYLELIFVGAHSLAIIRAIRLLRIFRVLKLVQFVVAASSLKKGLKESQTKIIVFLAFVLIVCTLIGTVMYLIEGRESGFTSIPRSIYWAVVTLTTVGYGDISPQTPIGQLLAMILMITGYGVIAVPTGLVTAGILKSRDHDEIRQARRDTSTRVCSQCSSEGHLRTAKYCRDCGAEL